MTLPFLKHQKQTQLNLSNLMNNSCFLQKVACDIKPYIVVRPFLPALSKRQVFFCLLVWQ